MKNIFNWLLLGILSIMIIFGIGIYKISDEKKVEKNELLGKVKYVDITKRIKFNNKIQSLSGHKSKVKWNSDSEFWVILHSKDYGKEYAKLVCKYAKSYGIYGIWVVIKDMNEESVGAADCSNEQ